MTNERVKTLAAKELRHLLSIEILYEEMRRKHELKYNPATISLLPIFSPELSNMKRSVELLSTVTRRIDFKTASSSAVYAQWYTYMFEWFSQQLFLHPYFA